MFFAYPKLLWLLVIPVTLAFWEWIRRGQPVVVPVDFRTARRGQVLRFLIQTANMLAAALLAVVVILLARPMKNLPPVVERELTNIEIVLDISPSISYPYGPQPTDGSKRTAYDAEMAALDQFLKYRQGDAFGLTVYAGASHFLHWVPLTTDTSAISSAKPFVQPIDVYDLWTFGKRVPGGFPMFWGTATFTALNAAADVLIRRAEGDRMVILMTDGGYEAGDGTPDRVDAIIDRFKANHIVCYCVYLSGAEKPGEEARVCKETGGVLFEVVGQEALNQVFARIDKMKKVKIHTKEPLSVDHLQPFLIPALGLLAAHLLALLGLRYTPW